MIEHHWSELRARLIEWYSQLPHPDTEAAIVEHFRVRPGLVMSSAEQVAQKVAAGTVRSGWAVLRTQLDADEARSRLAQSVVADDSAERAKAVAAAERWLANAGLLYDRPAEVENELFGPGGRLARWPELAQQMLAHWARLRPKGEQAEAASAAYQAGLRERREMIERARAARAKERSPGH